MSTAHLAIDLGASSGRAIVGILAGQPRRLRLEEVHRFEHLASPTPAGPVWDITGIWQSVLTGLRAGAAWCRENDIELQTVGVDTWGVDWALLGKSGELLALPHCYRDPQNEIASQRALKRLGGFDRLYERTGIQLLPFNTLFQVAARYEQEPKLFDAADRLLFLPDLLSFWLSGKVATERTIASTSSIISVETGDWDYELLEQLGLPTHIFGPIVEPGTTLGPLRGEVAEATGASSAIQVVASASHDTASAVAAVPATDNSSWAYVSSGTWSLLGAELGSPLVSDAARAIPFTNERGIGQTVRFLKNIAGMWFVQQYRQDLGKEGESWDFAQMTSEAESADPFRTLVDPNASDFATGGNMVEKMRDFARRTEQPVPESVGQAVRCWLESLAFSYRHTLEQLESVVGQTFDVLHIVGGGIQNKLLNQMTAEAIGRPVICGPVEATAIGNVLVQAMGSGEVADIAELRQIVARSSELERYEPGDRKVNSEAAERFLKLCSETV
ncbi:MAG: rhamnulokinase [Planctomycetes bacterium]|nr:rhamnulokinase [Planctomycetota bacterium]